MNCPRCGAHARVVNSRHAESVVVKVGAKLVQFAHDSVGWYTADWVARERRCSQCTWRALSIEIIDEDLLHLLREAPKDDS